ncbi:zinc finger protein 423-like isoform X2 [Lutzomyia longipalpis]|uniref:zinc finger protein 423-like isoform X2 n=1 Tax=Lutzomyia longipalpis TaxID=7200 RepID=UPI002483E3EC|nr:zinc finger protein 423-like isoform X2 [Lutzomyia longipalpis]
MNENNPVSLVSDEEGINCVFIKEESIITYESGKMASMVVEEPTRNKVDPLACEEMPLISTATDSASMPRKNTKKLIQINQSTTEDYFDPTRFHCALCLRSFSRKYKVMEHLLKHHNKKNPFRCNKCGMRFEKLKGLQAHKLYHNAVQCIFCRIKVRNNISLIRHIQKCHKRDYNSVEEPVERFETTPNRAEVIEESRNVISQERSTDPVQEPVIFLSQETQMDVLKEPDKTPPPHPQHVCDICSKKFTDQSERNSHIKEIHFGIKRKLVHTEEVICID